MARARKQPHWWGKGDAPHERWPEVTIPFDVTWSSARSRWETHKGKYYFDQAEADRACDFFPQNLKHHIGEFVGMPFVLMDYQRGLLTRPIFGWKKAADGRRRFRKVFAFIPKGGGKSPWGAGTGLYLFACDGEAAAEVYACAGDKLQARTVHDNAKTMVEQMMLDDDELAGDFEVFKDSITHVASRSTFKVLSADAKTKHGFRPHGVIFDEFHNQPNRDLYEALKKSMVKRRQPVIAMISHAGDDDEGICYEEYEYAKNVLSGANSEDEGCLPVVFEAKPDDDIYDEKVHARVNPGFGITVQGDAIMAEVMESKHDARKKNDVLRYMLNRWVNDAKAWIHVDEWDACDAPMPSDDELRQYPVAFGIDNAQKIDLAAGVAVFRLPLAKKAVDESIEVKVEDEAGNIIKRRRSLNYRIAIVPQFWLPAETLAERVKQDGVRYDLMVPDYLNVTDGRIIDADSIVRYVKDPDTKKDDLVSRFPLLKQAQFGYDPAFATEIALRLASMGLTTVEVLQNYRHLSEACQIFEALVKAKRVIHGGHRLLRLNLEHTGYKEDDAGRMRPVKLRRKRRIDGIVATLIAITRLMVMPEPKRTGERGRAFVYRPDGLQRIDAGDVAPAST
ncbi:MAG: terminase large subunit [Vicinamibacterales bacterium]